MSTPRPSPAFPAPIAAFVPEPPDADWNTIRLRVLGHLAAAAAPAQTDHNAADPGITLAESAAFGLADLHYRIAESRLDGWPLAFRGWQEDPARHWHGVLPARRYDPEAGAGDGAGEGGGAGSGEAPGPLTRLAAALAGPAPAGAGSGSGAGGGGTGGTGRGGPGTGSTSPVAATVAAVLEGLLQSCASPADAAALLSGEAWSPVFQAAERPVVATLLRTRLVRRIAHEQADVVARTVFRHLDAANPAAGDGRAAAELAAALPVWEEEATALVRRERRRLAQEAVAARLAGLYPPVGGTRPGAAGQPLAGTPPTGELPGGQPPAGGLPAGELPGRTADLRRHGLDVEEAWFALVAAADPGLLGPDGTGTDGTGAGDSGTGEGFPAGPGLEDPAGRTRVWPPHPVQALACEPVTSEDYAARARSHPEVGRAWVLSGRLPGVAWNGLPTGLPGAPAVDAAAAALTIIVERVAGTGPVEDFLRSVLRTAVGAESTAPFPDWRTDVEALEPRRTLGDEIGAGLLATAPVLVQATLVAAAGTDRAALIEDVRDRIAGFFAAGRRGRQDVPEAPGRGSTHGVDGPWPRVEQPPGGWIPGEPIRFTELVEAIAAEPRVWGVERLAMKLQDGPDFVPQAAGQLDIPPNAVPVLAAGRCLRVVFSRWGSGDDA